MSRSGQNYKSMILHQNMPLTLNNLNEQKLKQPQIVLFIANTINKYKVRMLITILVFLCFFTFTMAGTWNYSLSYVNCTTDSYGNACGYKCCTQYTGGILDSTSMCAPHNSLCTGITAAIVTTANNCDNDDFTNTCNTKCCMSVAYGGSYLAKLCSPAFACKGISVSALSPSNLEKYSKQIGAELAPSTLSGGAIAGFVVLSVACAGLLGGVGFLIFKLKKIGTVGLANQPTIHSVNNI